MGQEGHQLLEPLERQIRPYLHRCAGGMPYKGHWAENILSP